MKRLIEEFPDQIRESATIAESARLSKPPREIRSVLICGMGGSGIGGMIVKQWIEQELKVPLMILQDYTIPGFVNEHTLVIGSSYSGNTEETLMAITHAHQRGAMIAGVCSGGQLLSFCQENGFDCIQVTGGFPPRAATGYSIVQLLRIFESYGLISTGKIQALVEGAHYLEEKRPEIHSLAEKIAAFMFGKYGIVYSGAEYECVVIRTRQQFNENSKYLCSTHVIPEMNHNELVGWGGGDERYAVLFIDGVDIHSRNKKRMEISRDIIARKTPNILTIQADGESQITRILYLIHLIDWASYYLQQKTGADIMDIKVIDHLKNELSKI